MTSRSEATVGALTQETPVPALKEWAAIWAAVLDGTQIVDLRKGGIAESTKHFRLESRRFWLYPSYVHQREDLLKPEFRQLVEQSLRHAPSEAEIVIPGWAEVVAAAELSEAADLGALDEEFIWMADYAASRLRWKPKHPLHLLVLRAYRLADPLRIPFREAYRGCSSWAPLQDLPEDPTRLPAEPALGDAAFSERLEALLGRPPGGAELRAT